ncbi:MAG: class I SAM-dependent methyltransferase [Spirochaetales bacterium]|nr:class I SAM-dependent methyltransferase [Spirochaetales bacterium]
MNKDVDIIKEIDKNSIRKNLRGFTWQAFNLLPQMTQPEILDLGCGTGVPTIELAILSKGHVTAVDSNRKALAVLRENSRALNLTKQITIKKGNIKKPGVKKNHFDIVWSEGAVNAIGFEKALSSWRPLLKQEGFLVIHDEKKGYETKVSAAEGLGYEILHRFFVSVDAWFTRYIKPLSERAEVLREEYHYRKDLLAVIDRETYEVKLFRDDPNAVASIFYLMKKK